MPWAPWTIPDATGATHALGPVARRLLVVAVEGTGLALVLVAIGLLWEALS